MTKRERLLIKRAIRLIHGSNEYFEGMNILAKLVGWKPAEIPTASIIVDACMTAAQEFNKKRSAR